MMSKKYSETIKHFITSEQEVDELIHKAKKEAWSNILISPRFGEDLTISVILTNKLTRGQLSRNVNINDYNIFNAFVLALGSLDDLKALNLFSYDLRYLPENAFLLPNLEYLKIQNCLILQLPKFIAEISGLRTLSLSNNNYLRSLPIELEKLRELRSLEVSDCSLDEFPEVITKLVMLEELDLSNTYPFNPTELEDYLKEFSEGAYTIQGLENGFRIRTILEAFNHLFEIPPEIGLLTKLKRLNLSNNQIVALPKELNHLKNLKLFDIRGNKLDIPLEVVNYRKDPRSILNYYFRNLNLIKRAIKETKLILVGEGSVGKTSLTRRLIQDSFNENEPKTEGIDLISYRWIVPEKKSFSLKYNIRINIWDFGGQEIMHATHQFFLTKRSLYLLVLDARLTQEENRVEYWLKIIQSFGGESPVLLVGNKIDQHPLDIDRTGLQKKYPNIVGILETSAVTGVGIEELRSTILEQVDNLPHTRDLLPETWFTIKTKLKELGNESNFITHEKYLELCSENEVSDETSQHTLIGFLHDLGVVLHFQDDPRLEALGILNPQWVTSGVYKILNAKSLFENKGVLPIAMLNDILNLPEYPRDKRLFIVDMMKKFELCYDIEPDKTFLVPDLLPKDEPDLNFNGVPAFEYLYPVLPSSVLTRFIVRMNTKIATGQVWRSGVLLKIGENRALVKADVEERKVTIAIDGLEHTRRDALSAIRYQLDEIHDSIKALNPEKRVPIPDAPNAEPLDYDYLLQLERDGELENLPVKDGNRLVKVNVRKLLSGVVSETERRQSTGNTTNIYIGGDVKGGAIIAGDDNEVNK